MSNDKQIDEMAQEIRTVKEYIGDKNLVIGEYRVGESHSEKIARHLIEEKGYRKASDVALEAVDDFQSKIRHIFIDMCNGNDYNTVNLLQIDSAIEALFDSFVSELKKKYIGSEGEG